MNQRLIWNFEFSTEKFYPLMLLEHYEKEHLKWESRFFWNDNEPILLKNIDNALMNINNYEQKHKEDYYYLIPKENYNIKRRRTELLYKPIVKRTQNAIGFGPKVNLEEVQNYPQKNNKNTILLQKILHQTQEEGVIIHVKKVAFTYKFPTSPTIKLELGRLEVFNKVYFSACIEGRSLYLVETISKYLMDEKVSCDYVSFLKSM